MANSAYKTLPILRGSLAAASPFNALMARSAKRIRAYQLGAMVSTDGTAVTNVSLQGLGDFAALDYVIICKEISYGNTSLWIPDPARIRNLTAIDVGNEDVVTVDSAVDVSEGEYMFCLGADTYTGSVLQFDGSTIQLYDSHGGDVAEENSNGYLASGTGGHFRGWVTANTQSVDLLISDSSDQLEAVIPFYPVGPTVAV